MCFVYFVVSNLLSFRVHSCSFVVKKSVSSVSSVVF